jgi:hypothetical protein
VKIGGQDVGGTNTPLTYSFSPAAPTGLVSAPGYPTTTVSFPFYIPQMRIWVEPPLMYIGRPTQVTVRAADTTTGASVAGRVKMNGQDLAATNTPFTYTFSTSPPSGIVSASYYANTPIPWPPFRQPQLMVAVQPYPVQLEVLATYTVRAQDADTKATADGAVKVNGQVVARTNLPFTYKFVRQRVRKFDPETQTYIYEMNPPVGTVSVPGYPDVNIDLGV